MRLGTRLSLVFALVAVSVAAAVGAYAVHASRADGLATIDRNLSAIVTAGGSDPVSALPNVLSAVQASGIDVSIFTVSLGNVRTAVESGSQRPSRIPDYQRARALIGSPPISIGSFRWTAVNVGAGLVLIVAESTSPVDQAAHHLSTVVGGVATLCAVVAMLLAQFVSRRDRRDIRNLVGHAAAVAAGEAVTAVPVAGGSREIRELSDALNAMIGSLGERVETERRAADTMQQMLGDASHELRTPLTVIKGYQELLSGGSLDSAGRERALARIETEVSRMEQLVADLLTSAELRGRALDDLEDVELVGLVRHRVEEWSSEHPSHPVECRAEGSVMVRARTDLIGRVLINALSNVERYTPEEAPVRVSVIASGPGVELVIEDGGAGLAVYGEKPRRFWRGDNSRSRETGGTGLGMSIMADIAESLGGTFTTRRSELGGLAVVVELLGA